MEYSVLMSVYVKENPEVLRQSMESIRMQTAPTNDFVLVCDGPLNEELDAVISDMQRIIGDMLHVVRLQENAGLGNALNAGMRYCKNDLVARMDSDDIAYPDRCERQLTIFKHKSDVDICSGTVEEFSESTEKIEVQRIPPETHEEILAFAKKRNPFNHPCVMYRKEAVEAAGGYQDFYLLEDYYLWLRMLMDGRKGYNIQDPLLYMRAGSDLYKRRAGWKYAKAQCELFMFMKKKGLINSVNCIISCIIRVISSCVPNWLRKRMFKSVLRK